MRNFEHQLQAKSASLGLKLFGITSPESPSHYSLFDAWITEKSYGQMDFLGKSYSREKRKNPALIIPNCKSILVVGLPNHDILPISTSVNTCNGLVASFATNRDYHDLLTEKITALRDFIDTSLSISSNSKICADSSPVLEKELAQRAGLGWIGKNSLLISPIAGSFFNLGELFMDIGLIFSNHYTGDLCKDCHLCVDACPTGCINANRTIKADKCISYLTIEHKGIIERRLRNTIGNWVFGCDICQQVCPFNKGFLKTFNDHPHNQAGLFDLNQEIKLTESEFHSKYKESPIKRIGYDGYLRNLIIATGNYHLSSSIPFLENFLTTAQNPLLRIMSAWALGKIIMQSSSDILKKALEQETNPDVREEIFHSLSDLSD